MLSGRIRMTLDENSDIVSTQDYYPYGEILRSYTTGGNVNDKYKFTEKERDVESGYDYFGARYYDSDLGRWLQVDPMSAQRPGFSPYNYCQNNPLVRIDPTGMLDTKYEDEEGNLLAETNDGNDATVTVSNSQEFLDEYNNTTVLARDGEKKNSEWIAEYGSEMQVNGGDVQDWALESFGVAAVGFTSRMLKETYGHTTIRISSVKGNSPWIYNSWGGGSRGNVRVMSTGKALGILGKVVGWSSVIYTTSDMIVNKNINAQGVADVAVGVFGVLGGAFGAAAALGWEVGKIYGPSKWFK